MFVLKRPASRARTRFALLAQVVEHLTLNQGVQGSSPWRRTESTVFDDEKSTGDGVFFVFPEAMILYVS